MTVVKAIYKPRPDVERFCFLDNCVDKEYEFKEMGAVNGERKFFAIDKNIPQSCMISEHDLEFVDDETVPASK